MTDLIVVPQAAHWQRLKRLVLDSVSSPITRRVYNLGLDEFFAWYGQDPRPGFTKATVCAWRVALEARGLGAVSINVRITAVRKLAVEAADNGLLAPELAAGITRVKGVASKGVRLGNWLSASVPSPARTELLSRAPGWAAWFHLVIAKSVPDRTHA
jgi:predicted phosphoadenosine phosphosulfate sulfurtransferase